MAATKKKPAKRAPGRPSTYTDSLARRICVQIAEGKSIRKICQGKGMPTLSTIFKWLDEKPAFSEQYARARAIQAEVHADEIVDIADTESDPAKARVRVDARKWIAVKLLPRKYGDRVTNEHRGHVTTTAIPPEKLEAMSDEQLRALESAASILAGGTGSDPQSGESGDTPEEG